MREPTVHRTVRVVYLSDGQSRTEPIVEIPADQWDALSTRLQAAERLAECLSVLVTTYDAYLLGETDGVPFAEAIEGARTELAAYRAAGTEPG